jgi:hypothetical protein
MSAEMREVKCRPRYLSRRLCPNAKNQNVAVLCVQSLPSNAMINHMNKRKWYKMLAANVSSTRTT